MPKYIPLIIYGSIIAHFILKCLDRLIPAKSKYPSILLLPSDNGYIIVAEDTKFDKDALTDNVPFHNWPEVIKLNRAMAHCISIPLNKLDKSIPVQSLRMSESTYIFKVGPPGLYDITQYAPSYIKQKSDDLLKTILKYRKN